MGVYGIAVLSFFFVLFFLKGPYLCLEKEKEKNFVLCSRTKLGSLQEMYKKAGSTFELFAFAGINLLLFFAVLVA